MNVLPIPRPPFEDDLTGNEEVKVNYAKNTDVS